MRFIMKTFAFHAVRFQQAGESESHNKERLAFFRTSPWLQASFPIKGVRLSLWLANAFWFLRGDVAIAVVASYLSHAGADYAIGVAPYSIFLVITAATVLAVVVAERLVGDGDDPGRQEQGRTQIKDGSAQPELGS
jgi:hypothetical protein